MKRGDLPAEHHSIRLGLFELYEAGSDFPLVVTSDRSLLTDLEPSDRVILRHWVREGGANTRCAAIGHPTVTPESLIPCQLVKGHSGNHWSTSGCAGGVTEWSQW